MVKLKDCTTTIDFSGYYIICFQAAGIAFTYIIVLMQFTLNNDLIEKYRSTFTVALNTLKN